MRGSDEFRAANVVKSPLCRKGFVEVRDAERRVPSKVGWISLMVVVGLNFPGGVLT
jgi:hypothetical protein